MMLFGLWVFVVIGVLGPFAWIPILQGWRW